MPATKTPMRIASDQTKGLSKRVALTLAVIDVAACPAGSKDRIWIYDTKQPGLALMVTATGAKAFYLYRKFNGQPQRVRLGGFPDITIDQARRLAQQTTASMSGGINPMAEKRAARVKGMTLGELFKWFLESWAKPRKRSWKDDENRYNKHLKPWASRRLTEITSAEVATLHQRISTDTSQATANRVLALLSTMFNKARVPLKLTVPNPCKGIEKFEEHARERYLSAEEMQRFFAALESKELAADWRDYFKLALFTAARRSNTLSMRWDELDLAAGTWSITGSKFKNKKPVIIHLSEPAIVILKSRKESTASSEWVFPSHSKAGHLVKPDFAWEQICTDAKLTELRIHDLRRTMGSWMAAGNTSLPIIGKMLGHKSQATTAIYSRLQLDPVKGAVDAATAAMIAASKGKDA